MLILSSMGKEMVEWQRFTALPSDIIEDGRHANI